MFSSLIMLFVLALYSAFPKQIFAYELKSNGIKFQHELQSIQTIGPFSLTHNTWQLNASKGTLNSIQHILLAQHITLKNNNIPFITSPKISLNMKSNILSANNNVYVTWNAYQLQSQHLFLNLKTKHLYLSSNVVLKHNTKRLQAQSVHIDLAQKTLLATKAKMHLEI